MEQAGGHAVEEVEHGTDDHPGHGPFDVAVEGHCGGNATRNEVAARDHIGNLFLHCLKVMWDRDEIRKSLFGGLFEFGDYRQVACSLLS